MSDDEERQSVDTHDTPSDGDTSETELMITTRERRKTAGNRYSQIVATGQADDDEEDDVALLFAEAEGEDEEYNSDEADDEGDMSSSDDDDDQGPNAAADDIEGEKELQRQAKIERQKKRKADMAMTTLSAIRKKSKIDPTSLHRAPEKPKPSKRKERISWLPDGKNAPGRSSLRKQTVVHRENMMERLKESEEQRLKNKAIREEKERIKQIEAPRQMTQADRLAEAEKNERRNAKSLNRWEAMEARRAEEQAAKLAALKERKLNGPVLTFYSSAHTYRGPKAERTSPGPNGVDDFHLKKRGRKSKATHELQATAPLPLERQASSQTPSAVTQHSEGKAPQIGPTCDSSLTASASQEPRKSNDGWLAGIHEYASAPGSGHLAPHEPQNLSGNHDMTKPSPEQHDEKALKPEEKESTVVPSESEQPSQSGQQCGQSTVPAEQERPIETVKLEQPSQGEQQSTPQDTDSQLPLRVEGDDATAIQQESTKAEAAGSAPSDISADAKQTDIKIHTTTSEALPQPELTPKQTEEPNPGQKQAANGEHIQPADKVGTKSETATVVANPEIPDRQGLPPEPTMAGPPPVAPALVPALATDVFTGSPLSDGPKNDGQHVPPPPVEEVVSARNVMVLDGFEDLGAEARQAYSVFYGTKRPPRPAKHVGELCAITGLPARYRDPTSGAGYANVGAFRKLKELQKHGFQWSSMLGCYVGRGDHAARGVPQGFLGE